MANLELYRIFTEVAKYKNITKASEQLNISQPAVTRHIKNLEQELNTVLFNRTKGMELTEAGKKLYNEISTYIEKIVEIDSKFYNSKEIILGTYATMLSKVLSSSIAEFYDNNQDARIVAITDNSKVLNNPLQSGEFDILITRKFDEAEYDTNKYKFISLGEVEYVLIANNDSDLCTKKKIKIKDLEGKIVYIPRGSTNSTNSFKSMIEKYNKNIEIKRIDSITMAQILQKSDNSVGESNKKYWTKEIENKLVTVLDTDFKIPTTEIGIYYRKDNTSAELRNLIKIIRKNFK